MATPSTSVNLIQAAIDEFVAGLPAIQKKQFDQIYITLKELTLDRDGLIKPNVANMKVMNKVRLQMEAIVENPTYLSKVADIQNEITKIADAKTTYFSNSFSQFNEPPVVGKMQDSAFRSATTSLTEAGVNEYVVNEAVSVLEQAVTSGSSFSDMVNNLEVQMLGNADVDPRLVSYSKQIMTDTLTGFTRDYNNLVVRDLGLQWYMYVGALVKSSRPFCDAMIDKKYVHESELGSVARGVIDGKTVSREGMMPDTNSTNIISRCGGYNCNHELVPISEELVPKSLREKFEEEITEE